MIGAEQRAVKGAMRVLYCRRTLQRREARAEEKSSGSGGEQTDRSLLRIPPRHQEAVTGEQGAGKQAYLLMSRSRTKGWLECPSAHTAESSCPAQPYFPRMDFGEKRSAEHPNCRSSTEGGAIKIPAARSHSVPTTASEQTHLSRSFLLPHAPTGLKT